MKPNYKHDCDACRFLGSVTGPNPRLAMENPPLVTLDLWFCERAELGGSVIARYGNDGPNYNSSPIKLLGANSHPALLWANALLWMEGIAKEAKR